jgi:hypothetical protein
MRRLMQYATGAFFLSNEAAGPEKFDIYLVKLSCL